MMEETNLRIRIVFKNGVLSKSQKKDGLKHSWVLLKSHHETISDVVSYIIHSFDLLHSCPHGIILSMEGYVLPEFESTSILKDKDVISVKRKETRLIDANKAIEDVKTYIENQIVEKQPILSRVRLLAIEEFNEEAGGYQSETDKAKNEVEKSISPVKNPCNGDSTSKKRKASSKLGNTKKKRKREAIVNTSQKKHLHNCERITKPQKKRKHENRTNQDALSCPSTTEKCVNDLESESNSESELDENKEDTIIQASRMSDKAKKVSRSTKRKRTQRAIRRSQCEKAKMDEQCDKQHPVKDMTEDAGSKKDVVANIIQKSYEDSDAEDDDLVPVEIRPGLIRYTPSRKVKEVQEANGLDVHSTENGTCEEHSTQHNQVAKEAYCWNGITNKRKGQKWGQKQSTSTWDDRKQSTSSWKDSRDVNGHSSGAWAAKNQSSSSWQDSREFDGQSYNTWADKKHPQNKKSIDFDKLIPLIDPPKEGDILAYRLLELSSSWCPELSSFRVGKITSFEPESNKVVLVPVPEYPLNLEKKAYDGDDADEQPLGSPVYNEDGSLETDFMSLNDVRIVKLGELIPLKCTKIPTTNGNSTPQTSKTDNGAQDASKKAASEISNQELHTPAPGPAKGKKDVWEEITEAVSAKKAQLMQEDSWNKKVTPAKKPWSYRSLRSSSIGTTMARLRAQNGASTS